ncbi:MAG: DUF721 domain-containing protein [Prevotellaceae bacterium]|nr:DUF721 domain-containing protein [Prevotella sp.]MDD7530331.1 DUF721 domain-containing protein [Prevotellaceae bacterium]MDY2634264.1 DUF721 domain-containing protein [Prevotella sp.]
MFRRKVLPVAEIVNRHLREKGLEMPLYQRRTIDAWEKVCGEVVARHTTHKYIRNQTLFVGISSPALRSELSMMRQEILQKLVDEVGHKVVYDIKIVG